MNLESLRSLQKRRAAMALGGWLALHIAGVI